MGTFFLNLLPNPLLSFLAMIAGARGNYPRAIRCYKKIFDRDKKDSEALAMIMQCYRLQGDNEAAFLYAQMMLEVKPTDFDALQLIVSYYLDQEKYEQVYSFVCRALEHSPKRWDLSKEMEPGSVLKGIDKILPAYASIQEAQKSLDRTFKHEKDWHEWARNYQAWYEKKYFPSENIP